MMTDKEKSQLRKQLIKLLNKDAVDEAFEILTNCSEKWLNSFREELKKKSENNACVAIDFAKMQLVRDGKMKIDGHFGGDPEDYCLTPDDIAKL